METFLVCGFALSLLAGAWGWRTALRLAKAWQKEEDAHNLLKNSYINCDTERRAAMDELNGLLEKLRIQALTPSIPKPHNRRVRAGSYAEIRKANEVANRNEAETEEARERDTAFVEK